MDPNCIPDNPDISGIGAGRPVRSPACARPSAPRITPAATPCRLDTLPRHAPRAARPVLALGVVHDRFSTRCAPPLAPAIPRPNPPQKRFHHLEPCACATVGLAPDALPRLRPPFRPSVHPSDDTLPLPLPLRVHHVGFSARCAPPLAPALPAPRITPATTPCRLGTLPQYAAQFSRPPLPLRARYGPFSARCAPPLAPAVPCPNPPQKRVHHLEVPCPRAHLKSPTSYWPCACATAGLAPGALPRLRPRFRPRFTPATIPCR
ncbi:hypothetical protein C8F04DRAFT_1278752 [Mycena alexandri]|uniref:Uncharacterized protein n=1 Tax=Mycena alexandri TaxID=1745969 RepID=A0AAD6WKY9_9AGAR|nr:hypothetical protein C8F04DRAFT_1278752 [Mycena alexandri]